jgi:hypothetical protein
MNHGSPPLTQQILELRDPRDGPHLGRNSRVAQGRAPPQRTREPFDEHGKTRAVTRAQAGEIDLAVRRIPKQ